MHAHGIAHRSPKLSGDAIVYDPRASCHPKVSHPAETEANPSLARGAFGHSRTERDGTYYFADFQVAKRYHIGPTSKHKVKRADETTVMDYPFLTRNNFAPEFKTPENKCDPFKVDVYPLGDEIFRCFFQVRSCLNVRRIHNALMCQSSIEVPRIRLVETASR